MNKLAKRILDASPTKWNAIVAKYNAHNNADMGALTEAIDDLQSLAIHAVRAAVYLQIRYLTGFSADQDGAHVKAVKLQNTAVARVRRALGFTQAHFDMSF
jgi:hypothetical protein